MRVQGFIAVGLMLSAGMAAAGPTGPHLLRDSRGKVAGVTGVGSPCDPADVQCSAYTSTGVITRVDRDRDGTPASFALKLPSGDIDLQNFNETAFNFGKGGKRDLSRWLRPGMTVTVSGTGSGAPGDAVVDRVVEASDQ